MWQTYSLLTKTLNIHSNGRKQTLAVTQIFQQMAEFVQFLSALL